MDRFECDLPAAPDTFDSANYRAVPEPPRETTSIQPGLIIIQGNRLEDLRQLAVDWMRRYPLQSLENETILVQSNGIAQWIKLALAEDPEQGGCGIAAAIDVSLPARFLWHMYSTVLDDIVSTPRSPLDKAALSWRLFRLLPELLQDDTFAALRQFLRDDSDLRKRYQLAERLADLFDQYQVYRADWLQDWASGQDRLALLQGGSRPLPDQARWQSALWRAVLQDIGPLAMHASRAGLHRRFLQACATQNTPPAGVPRRVIVFGISSLPAQMIQSLAAMAGFSQILLFVHNPCRHHWTDIVEGRELLRHEYRRQKRREGEAQQADTGSLHAYGHPLLAAWGKQGRDYINLLDQHDDPSAYRTLFGPINQGQVDLFTEGPQDCLLHQLQNDILELRSLDETRTIHPPVDPAQDRSIRFHSAHSPQREVEILHDQLLDRFQNDPQLRPRDIIVMVPDINSYAPHVQAVFGQLPSQDPRYIPFSITDQVQRGVDPLLVAVEQLLHIDQSRFTVSTILDLLDVPAVHAKLQLTPQDLPLLHHWIRGAGIRWGLDEKQRNQLDLPPDLSQNTWLFGLRRMLLGYASGAGESWSGVEPYDEVGGLDAALAGQLYQFLQRLSTLYHELRTPASPALWVQRLYTMLGDLFEAQTPEEQNTLTQFLQHLEDWQQLCEQVGLDEALPLSVVQETLLSSMETKGLSRRFFAGAVNFCTLMPMRAIPFQIVCLLGMNDGDYPRPHVRPDFDLMTDDYRPGDRSRREDDRYLLLEALLSARQQLYVSWVGRSIQDNSERAPSTLIGQLRDHLASGWRLTGAEQEPGALLDAFTLQHPLQPFSRRYFQGDSQLYSYAREWAEAHDPTEVQPEQPLTAWQQEGWITLSDLQRFLHNPTAYFFRQRLGVYLNPPTAIAEDEEPFTLTRQHARQLSQQLLDVGLQTDDLEGALQAMRHQGERLQNQGLLPPAGFGQRLCEQLLQPLPTLLQRRGRLLQHWPQSLEDPQPLSFDHHGLELRDWLSHLHQGPAGLLALDLQPTDLELKKRGYRVLLNPWVRHLAANACNFPLHSALLASDDDLLLPPLPPAQAATDLQQLLYWWLRGMSQPLPVVPATALAFLQNGENEARRVYEGGPFHIGERQYDAALARQYPDFDSLLADGLFLQCAQALYLPLLQADWQPLDESDTD